MTGHIPWIPSKYIRKIVGVDAFLTKEGIFAYIRSVNIREELKDEEVTYCHHQIVGFRRKRSYPIDINRWSGPVRPTEEVLKTFGPFNDKPFPEIIKRIELTEDQINKATGEVPQQTYRNVTGWDGVQVPKRPKIKSRIVRVELGRDSRMPRQMGGWDVEAIHLVGIERKATEGIWDSGKLKMPSCAKGYVEPITYGDLELEYLYHTRARHIYLDVKDPNQKGQALFLVRFRKQSTVVEEEEIVHGNV